MATKTTNSTTGAASDLSADLAGVAEERLDAAQGVVADTARRIERLVQDGIETFRSQSRVYVDSAGEQLGAAQQYVTERVKERPVAATMAGLGVGVLLGMLIAGGSRRHKSH